MPTTSNEMYYEERGHGTRTIVLLPGFGTSIACFEELAPLLDGYRSILIDLPGHARSVGARADGDLAHMAETVFEACDEIGLTQFSVAGLSLGGAIGVRMGLDQPERIEAVIGIMPWNAGGTKVGEDDVIKASHDAYGDMETMRAGIEAMSHDIEKAADLFDTMPTVTEAMWKGWLSGGAYTSMSEELPGLRPPAMYLVGGDDIVVDVDKQIEDIRAIPGGKLVLFTDEGHLSCYESPALLAAEMCSFLDANAGTVVAAPA
jgi:pimeloyl-ACP methyl ester carboxylesterase